MAVVPKPSGVALPLDDEAPRSGTGQHDRCGGVFLRGVFLGEKRAGDEQQETGKEAERKASFHRSRQ